MMGCLRNVYRLGLKELSSLRGDVVMVVLIIFTFTVAIYTVSQHAQTDVRNAAVGIVDNDHSQLSRQIRDALLKPYFKKPEKLSLNQIDRAMDTGRFTFVIDIPHKFEADLLSGHQPSIQLNVDATAMTQAGQGARYIQQIILREVEVFQQKQGLVSKQPALIVIRTKFNPNMQSKWFLAVMQLVNMITLLAILLTGAALIREREHGTIEHLLVMPLRPIEIMLAKVWANGLVIVVASFISLKVVVQGVLQVPIIGSIPLFVLATVIYLFSVTALGIYLATLARSMPQFGLLAFPIFMVMNLLSGGATPLDSMPVILQWIMQLAPSTHYVSIAQGVLYRGAGLEVVWPDLLVTALLGVVFFFAALTRFRKMLTLAQ
jgi:ABC-2 type transport system permease protein